MKTFQLIPATDGTLVLPPLPKWRLSLVEVENNAVRLFSGFNRKRHICSAATPDAAKDILGVVPYQPPPPPPVPQSLTPRQFLLGLLGLGITEAQVVAAMAAIPDLTQREALRIEWERSLEVKRNHPLLNELAPQFGLTSQQVDALFLAASKL